MTLRQLNGLKLEVEIGGTNSMAEKDSKAPPGKDGFDWAKIRSEYVTKKITYAEICEKYGCSMSVLTKRASAEKWSDARKKHRKKVERKTEEKVASRKAEKNAEDILSCEKLAEDLLLSIEQAIRELNIHILKSQKQTTHEETDEDGTVYEIVERKEKIKKAKSIIKTDDIKKLSAALKDIRDILEGDGDTDNSITVTLEGALKDYGA